MNKECSDEYNIIFADDFKNVSQKVSFQLHNDTDIVKCLSYKL